MNEIIVKPGKTKLSEHFIFFLCSLFIGGFIACIPIMLHEYLKPISITQNHRNLYFISGIILSLVFIYIFSARNKEKYHWIMNEKYLIRGKKNNIKFQLSDIEKIIIGIPQWEGLSGKLFRTTNLKYIFQASIIIKMKNQTFIPLNLMMVENGAKLMEAIIERFKEKIDKDYNFSKKEKRLLRSPKWNSVISVKTT